MKTTHYHVNSISAAWAKVNEVFPTDYSKDENSSAKMEIAKACYSVSKLKAAADMVKAINWSVNRKNEHFAKYTEIAKVFEFAAVNLNRWLFDPEIELKEYRSAAFNYKAYKAEELNKMLRRQYRYICNELNGILTAINNGEVDYCE